MLVEQQIVAFLRKRAFGGHESAWSLIELVRITDYLQLEAAPERRQILGRIIDFFNTTLPQFEGRYNNLLLCYTKVLTATHEKLKLNKKEWSVTRMENGLVCPEQEELFGRLFCDMSVEQQIVAFISKRPWGRHEPALKWYRHLKRCVRALYVSRRIIWQKPVDTGTEKLHKLKTNTTTNQFNNNLESIQYQLKIKSMQSILNSITNNSIQLNQLHTFKHVIPAQYQFQTCVGVCEVCTESACLQTTLKL